MSFEKVTAFAVKYLYHIQHCGLELTVSHRALNQCKTPPLSSYRAILQRDRYIE